jgi:hypothetical protein
MMMVLAAHSADVPHSYTSHLNKKTKNWPNLHRRYLSQASRAICRHRHLYMAIGVQRMIYNEIENRTPLSNYVGLAWTDYFH